jgi:predicted RNase H-like HicB family nuclease
MVQDLPISVGVEGSREFEIVAPQAGDIRGGSWPPDLSEQERTLRDYVLLRWEKPESKAYRCEIRLSPEAEGGYSVYSPELPGVLSEGDNAEEAVRNMAEALQAALQTYLEDARGIPWVKTFDAPNEGETRLWIVVNV